MAVYSCLSEAKTRKWITMWEKAKVRKPADPPEPPHSFRWEKGLSLFELNFWLIGCFIPSPSFIAGLLCVWHHIRPKDVRIFRTQWPKVGTRALLKEGKKWGKEKINEISSLSSKNSEPNNTVFLEKKQHITVTPVIRCQLRCRLWRQKKKTDVMQGSPGWLSSWALETHFSWT